MGLSLHEAQAYVSLLEVGHEKASTLAARAHIPRGKVYGVLNRLHERGLVEVIPESPKQYQAVSIGSYVDGQVRILREKLSEHTRARAVLEARRRVPMTSGESKAGEVLLYRGRKAILRKCIEMVDSARKEVVAISSGPAERPFLGAVAPTLLGEARAGVSTSLLLDVRQDTLDLAKTFTRVAEVRHRPLIPGQIFLLVDQAQLLFARIADSSESQSFAFWSNDAAIASAMRSFITSAWDQSVDLRGREHEIRTGQPAGRSELLTDDSEILAAFQGVERGATKEVWISSVSSALEVLLPQFLPLLRGHTKKNVLHRFLVENEGGVSTWADTLRDARRAGFAIEVRCSTGASLGRLVGSDEAQLLFVVGVPSAPARGGSARSRILIIRTTDPGLIAAHRKAFEVAWQDSTPLVALEQTQGSRGIVETTAPSEGQSAGLGLDKMTPPPVARDLS